MNGFLEGAIFGALQQTFEEILASLKKRKNPVARAIVFLFGKHTLPAKWMFLGLIIIILVMVLLVLPSSL